MRTDVRMRCFYHATAFSEEEKNLRIQLLGSELELGSSGLSCLSVRINQETRFVKFACAKLC